MQTFKGLGEVPSQEVYTVGGPSACGQVPIIHGKDLEALERSLMSGPQKRMGGPGTENLSFVGVSERCVLFGDLS